MPPASTSDVTSASSMSSSSDISLPPSPPPSPPHDPYAFASSDEISAAPPAKKRKPFNRCGLGPPRIFPAADELLVLEAVAALKEQHGRLPSSAELAAAVAGSLPHVTAEQVGARKHILRQRYDSSVRRLRRGTVPVTDDDVRIFRLSKRIWEGAPRRRRRRRPRAEPHHERRPFEEMRGMYPCLAAEVEAVAAGSGHPGLLKDAFELMGDEQAAALEARVRKHRVAQMKADVRSSELTSTVVGMFIGAME